MCSAITTPGRHGEAAWQVDSAFLDINSIEPSVVTFFAHVISRWGKVTDKFWRAEYDGQIEWFREQHSEI